MAHRIIGECTRCGACCRAVGHPDMTEGGRAGCRFLAQGEGGGPPACPIRTAHEGAADASFSPEAHTYWQRYCKPFPRFEGEDAPEDDADWRRLEVHLADLDCGYRVVRGED